MKLRTPLLAAVLLVPPCLAQQPQPSPENLPRLRQAFTAGQFAGAAVAIAVLPDAEPVLLCAGTDFAGAALTARSLLPLGPLARMLAADALFLQHRRELTTPSGVVLAGRELPLGELLAGAEHLPDLYGLGGLPQPADRSTLLAAGETAAAAGVKFPASRLGVAELVLLEPLAFGRLFRDWPSYLRGTLAGYATGVDPMDVRQLDDVARGRVAQLGNPAAPGPGGLTVLVGSEPPLLRTLLSARDLATWWQWRLQHSLPLWEGPRMGRLAEAPRHPGEAMWSAGGETATFHLTALAYPGRKAALVLFGGDRSVRLAMLSRAFEADLFGDTEPAAAFGGVVFGRGGRLVFPGQGPPSQPPLAGSRWHSVPDADGDVACRLHVAEFTNNGFVFDLHGHEAVSQEVLPQGRGCAVRLASTAALAGWLVLWPRCEAAPAAGPPAAPEVAPPTHLTLVFVEGRDGVAAVPRVFELVRQ